MVTERNPLTYKYSSGFALPMVLWIVAALVLLTTATISLARGNTQWATKMVEKSQARAVAEGGVWLLISEFETNVAIKDGSAMTYQIGAGSVVASAERESGRVDLNRAKPEVIAFLVESVIVERTEARDLIDAILDWRDRDDIKREFGAEDAYYQQLYPPYRAKNGPFNAIAELRLVRGVTETVYQQLKPRITVLAHSATLDKNLRDKEGASIRKNTQTLPGRTDEPDEVDLRRIFSTGGPPIYRVKCTGTVGETTSTITAVVEINPNEKEPNRVLSWEEA